MWVYLTKLFDYNIYFNDVQTIYYYMILNLFLLSIEYECFSYYF